MEKTYGTISMKLSPNENCSTLLSWKGYTREVIHFPKKVGIVLLTSHSQRLKAAGGFFT